MHLFISAGEPSGDLHAANLARAVRRSSPSSRIVGFGGDKLAAAGADLLYPLTDLAVMWVGRAIANLRTFFRVADQAEAYFREQRPDAVVLIDYPGFHWHLAKRAKAAGIPVYYFVPPQLWAWAGWRVRKMRRTVDTVLTALPFEEEWYAARGVRTRYVGHPYFDELADQKFDPRFLLDQRADPRPLVTILPGSRNQEVAANLPLMLEAAKRVRAARPDVRFAVAAFNETQAAVARTAVTGLPIDVHVKRTPELIESATACLAVSGSVGLEMLYRRKPAVVVYRTSAFGKAMARAFMRCRYISLVNLLAGEELYPEFLTSRDDPDALAAPIVSWLADPAARTALVEKLSAVRNRVAVPGACERAADFILSTHHHAIRAA